MDMDWPAVDCVLPYARAGVYAFRTCGEGFADGGLERCVLGKNREVFDSSLSNSVPAQYTQNPLPSVRTSRAWSTERERHTHVHGERTEKKRPSRYYYWI